MKTTLIALMSVLFLTGCNDFVSLHPLYDEKTLATEPSLTGTWKSTEGDIWTFAPSDGGKYALTVTSPHPSHDDEEMWKFEAGLVELSGRLFLDLCGDSGVTGAPAHVFARIELHKSLLEGNTIEVAWLVASWMEERLKEEKHLTFLPADHGKTVLTAPTADLQDFFRRHAWDDDGFTTSVK